MRISLAILAAAAAANAAVLELDSFNEAILNANETHAATETKKWEELAKRLYRRFRKI